METTTPSGAPQSSPAHSMNGALGLLLALALLAIVIMYVWGMQVANSPEVDTLNATTSISY